MDTQLIDQLPLDCAGVVVIVDSAEASSNPVTRLAPKVKQLPLLAAIHLATGPDVAVVQLTFNSDQADHEVLDALHAISESRPGVPIVLVGRAENGRIALDLMDEPNVVAVAAMAAPVEDDQQVHGRRGQSALLIGEDDSDTVRSQTHVDRLRRRGLDVTWRTRETTQYASMMRWGSCQREVGQFVDRVLARTGC